MKRSLLALIVALLTMAPTAVHAQDDGGTQSPFVIGVGAREQAMGRTGVAISSNADALFWNPARLTASQWSELSLFRSKLFIDGSVYHAAFATYPSLDFGTLAIGYQRLSTSDIERRDERNLFLGSFDNGETNLLLGYGRPLNRMFSVGGALRVAQQSVDSASDTGLGFDLGFAFHRNLGQGLHLVTAGANIQNAIEPNLRLDEEDVQDPRSLKLGVGYAGRAPQHRLSWTSALDLDFVSTSGARAGFGAEGIYNELLALRAGIDDGHATLGFGVAWRQVRFDYALRADGDLSRNDRFSLAVRFGQHLGERRDARRLARQEQVTKELDALLQGREAEERSRALKEADIAYEERKFETCLRLYRRVLLLDPENEHAETRVASAELELQLAAAAALLESGELGQSATQYQSILERWPADARASSGLNRAREQLQASANREQQLNDLFKQSLAHFTDGNWRAAEMSLDELLRLDSAHELGRELRERVRTTRLSNGRKDLENARAFASQGKYDSALSKLASARKLLGPSIQLTALEREWKDQRLAASRRRTAPTTDKKIVEDAAPKMPKRRTLSAAERRALEGPYRVGLQAFSNGDFDRAIRNWREVWLEAPDYEAVSDYLIKAYLLQGVELYSSGNYEAALERCQRVLEIDPSHEKAIRYLDRIREEKLEVEQLGGGG